MNTLFLDKNEKIISQTQYTLYYLSSCQQGFLYLTNKRLLFNNPIKKTFEINLNEIIELRIIKRPWVLGVKVKQICISFRNKTVVEMIYIVLKKPEIWINLIKESMTLMLAERCDYNGANTKPSSNTGRSAR